MNTVSLDISPEVNAQNQVQNDGYRDTGDNIHTSSNQSQNMSAYPLNASQSFHFSSIRREANTSSFQCYIVMTLKPISTTRL
jgi:hypothetical protein